MKVSKSWLKELVDLKVSVDEVVRLLPLRSIGTKEVTDQFIELDMKGYNRADLLSMRGVAYEVAAITDSKVTFTEPSDQDYIWTDQSLPSTPVTVEREELCPLQCVAKIEGLKVAASSSEWQKKLADSGMRTVNNIADLTNIIMLEYGQPLHAFDAATVENETINVRLAQQGEEIITLDGKNRQLSSEDIVLADQTKPLDVAGVMGGKATEITDTTQTILLSASLFNPQRVRKTSARLGLSSEASKRFYHGLTKRRLLQALDAAIRMYQELGGELTAITIVGNTKDKDIEVPLKQSKVNSLIGIDLDKKVIEDSLAKLHFKLSSNQDGWQVMPPYWRQDIEIQEDLIEEIARLYGYEKIPAKSLPGTLPAPIDQTFFTRIHDLKQSLVEIGLSEIQTYSFSSSQVLKNLDYDLSKLIKIANPISSETEYMRADLWPTVLEKTVENLKYFDDVAIFEVGKTYRIDQQQPKEEFRLAIALSNKTNNPIEELIGMVQELAKKMDWQVEIKTSKSDDKNFHPTRQAQILRDGTEIGFTAEVHPRVIDSFGSTKRIAICELAV